MSTPRRAVLALGLAAPSLALAQGGGVGQWQPDRPIRVIVPFPAGGATDVWARLLAEPLAELLRVPVVVENRSGAAGMIGADAVAKSAPDGHTLLFTITPLVQSPIVLGNSPCDPIRDFTPIGQMGNTTLIFCVRGDHPPRTLGDFIAFARARRAAGQALMLGSWAAGSTAHVYALAMNNQLDLGMTHVAYRGEAPMVTAYLAREVDCGINSLTSVREHMATGKLRGLAALGDARHPNMRDIPTFFEQGVDVGRGWSGFIGLLGPARLPPAVLARHAEAFRQVMARDAIRRRLLEMDTDPDWLGPEDFARTIARVQAKWIEITRGMDLQL
ncbi:Bug family tripartite tricarboxylate transporter substrate binding protein [Roseococcus sp. DSY-14]|uniref:Bug family tripartite tricarboxylate transporter substrate binding protein n=1 Tax=Roseococcus sp. DSY-14 TaxID=3369650 RepID=UPI00387B3E27